MRISSTEMNPNTIKTAVLAKNLTRLPVITAEFLSPYKDNILTNSFLQNKGSLNTSKCSLFFYPLLRIAYFRTLTIIRMVLKSPYQNSEQKQGNCKRKNICKDHFIIEHVVLIKPYVKSFRNPKIVLDG